jgi:hypothetical protein
MGEPFQTTPPTPFHILWRQQPIDSHHSKSLSLLLFPDQLDILLSSNMAASIATQLHSTGLGIEGNPITAPVSPTCPGSSRHEVI